MKITACTHPGCRHEENQDNYRAGRLDDDSYWLALCDGMGGADSGGVASDLSVLFLQKAIERQLPDLLTPVEVREFLLDTLKRCNDYIYNEGRQMTPPQSMGTTAVVAVVRGNLVQIAHAGDSRLYVLQKNALRQITRDHSIVQELVEAGKLTAEQAYTHPNKNIITSAIGVDVATRIDYNEHKLGKGEMLLCCSDGLSNMIREADMVEILRDIDFYQTADRLVREAVTAGGFDNITAIVLEAD